MQEGAVKPTRFCQLLVYMSTWLAEIAQLLRELTAKEAQFLWSLQHELAFADIKQLVVGWLLIIQCFMTFR